MIPKNEIIESVMEAFTQTMSKTNILLGPILNLYPPPLPS